MSSIQSDPPSLQSGSLTSVEREVLRRAADVRRDLTRAAHIARRNGGSYLFFGVLSVLLTMTSDPAGLGLGVVLACVGLNARSSGARLATGDIAAPMRLALGEVALLVGLIAYCVAKMTIMRSSGAEIEAMFGSLNADLDIAALIDSTTDIVYASIIGIAFLYQGGLALYYRARGTAVRSYVEETPDWAREVVAIVAG
jgi:hypothetical protein